MTQSKKITSVRREEEQTKIETLDQLVLVYSNIKECIEMRARMHTRQNLK